MHRTVRLVMLVALLASSCTKMSARAVPPDSTSRVPTAPASESNARGAKLPALDARAIAPARRQIIRNADLTIESDDPGRAQQQAIALVERLGGFALSTDVVSAGGALDGAELRVNSVLLVLRVPADRFEPVLGELRNLGRGGGHEQVTGQDVTEEYLDLDARIRTQRALEAQLLEILKRTNAVGEMMEVHARLADVRGEIEKMEGRRRFLDDQTSLSTIRLEIAGPASSGRSGFGDSVRRAGADLVAVASGIVTVGIRLTGILVPVVLMIILPGYAITRRVMRRRARKV